MSLFARRRAPLVSLIRYAEVIGEPLPPFPEMPDWRTAPKTCRWCGGALSGRQRDYCGSDCMWAYSRAVYWDGASGLRRFVIARDRFACRLCGTVSETINEHGMRIPRARGLEVDHIVPVADGGTDHVDNLRTLCTDCHRGVTAEFMARLADRRNPRRAKVRAMLQEMPGIDETTEVDDDGRGTSDVP